MSYSDYVLFCVDCGEKLSLGKIVTEDQDSSLVHDLRFDGSNFDDGRAVDLTLLKLIERFLIIHRMHEIRLIPSALYFLRDMHQDYTHEWVWNDRMSNIMSRKIERPDPHGEADNASEKLIESLCRSLKKTE